MRVYNYEAAKLLCPVQADSPLSTDCPIDITIMSINYTTGF